MHLPRIDESLQGTLSWAMGRLRESGYYVSSPVTLSVDPKLGIMGYAKNEGDGHTIVISEWALDSEMLGGLVLHELAHIYFTERGAFSHDRRVLDEVLEGMKEREGMRAKEVEYLLDSFNHLQNILVDDLVFDVLQEREQDTVKRFFSEWVSEKPSGDPALDAALLCRNAFATASLKRRNLYDEVADMRYKNDDFLSTLGDNAAAEFDWIERFLERASAAWSEEEYRQALVEYFEKVLSLMRSSAKMHDLR
ncbi:MAG TPA: DUF5781 family protein [Nitrososphaerales archaeon]|nr:DUF5781 family protein [Nitrososphaerales archaeon]